MIYSHSIDNINELPFIDKMHGLYHKHLSSSMRLWLLHTIITEFFLQIVALSYICFTFSNWIIINEKACIITHRHTVLPCGDNTQLDIVAYTPHMIDRDFPRLYRWCYSIHLWLSRVVICYPHSPLLHTSPNMSTCGYLQWNDIWMAVVFHLIFTCVEIQMKIIPTMQFIA